MSINKHCKPVLATFDSSELNIPALVMLLVSITKPCGVALRLGAGSEKCTNS